MFNQTPMRYLYTALLMFAFWIILSGKFDPFHLSLGVISSCLVAWLSADIFMPEQREVETNCFKASWRFICYIPWLFKEIVTSTRHVVYLAIHPRMKELIDPSLVTFRTELTRDVSQVALANSITLTPGTITIRIQEGVFLVHAISRKAAAGLPGEMEQRLKWVFEES